jgi:hypothetical protein
LLGNRKRSIKRDYFRLQTFGFKEGAEIDSIFTKQSSMGVFLCWSGERSRSHQIAKILKDRIPEILQTAETFLSAVDIPPGTQWMHQLRQALYRNSFGILCITPENKDNPWMHFEAGALWRTEENRRVCPLLYDIHPTDITGPLSQLQSKELNRRGFLEIIKEVNQYGASTKIDESVLTKTFDRVWPDVENDLSKVTKRNLPNPRRDQRDMVKEILMIVRSIQTEEQRSRQASPSGDTSTGDYYTVTPPYIPPTSGTPQTGS